MIFIKMLRQSDLLTIVCQFLFLLILRRSFTPTKTYVRHGIFTLCRGRRSLVWRLKRFNNLKLDQLKVWDPRLVCWQEPTWTKL
jgi:hypothetical protein